MSILHEAKVFMSTNENANFVILVSIYDTLNYVLHYSSTNSHTTFLIQ